MRGSGKAAALEGFGHAWCVCVRTHACVRVHTPVYVWACACVCPGACTQDTRMGGGPQCHNERGKRLSAQMVDPNQCGREGGKKERECGDTAISGNDLFF